VTDRTHRPDVLITSAARKVLLVRAFRDALVRLGGGRVVAADIDPFAPALYEADAAFRLPRSDAQNYVAALVSLCRAELIGLIVPTRDEELPIMAAAREALASEGTVVLVAQAEAIAVCRDKARFTSAVRDAGLDAPLILDPRSAALPVFVKPRIGKGGRGATVARTAEALAAALSAIAADGGEPIVQEVIEAPEYTIDVFLDFEGRPITCVPRERVAVVAGESIVSRTVHDPDLANASLRLCSALGLVGHVTIQAFRTRERIVFIEVNPRYGGAANLGFAAGAPTPEFAIRAARGERLEPRLDDYESDLVMLRFADDRIMRLSEIAVPEVHR
jgi:carbamoyl-phosphate synthase large subunit